MALDSILSADINHFANVVRSVASCMTSGSELQLLKNKVQKASSVLCRPDSLTPLGLSLTTYPPK
jgi:hypothetical protein